jgi:hypothetical protein
MSLETNTHLEGTFTVMDVNGQILSEQKNLITDWGMTRITGMNNRTSEYVCSLAANLTKIWIGESTAPVQPKDYRLLSYFDGKTYTETNEPTITGTFYSLIDPGTQNEKLRIQFVKGSRFEFSLTTASQINEVGISSNYDPPYLRYLTGTHEWAGTVAKPGGPNQRAGSGPYGNGWPAPHEDALHTSLFSRARLSSPVDVIAGDVLIIKYVLNVVTNAHLVTQDVDFPFDMTTITTGNEMPSRKTNVRRKFFYELKSDNTITSDWTIPAGTQGGRAHWLMSYPNPNSFNYLAHFQFLPFLEVPAWGKNYIATYDNFNSSLYANIGNGTTNYPKTTALPAPYLGERIGTYQDPPWAGGSPTIKGPNYLNLKDRTTFKTLSSGHTFICQHRFLYNPGEWITNSDGSASVRNFAFLRRNYDSSWTSYSSNEWDIQPLGMDRANVGMFTALSEAYNPYKFESALYLGIDYTMTFTRSAF